MPIPIKDKTTSRSFLIIAVLAVLVLAGVLAVKYWPEPASENGELTDGEEGEEATDLDAANLSAEALAEEGWQTYRSEDWGYEFRYPDNARLEKIGKPGGPATSETQDIMVYYINPEYGKTGFVGFFTLEIPSLNQQESGLSLNEFVDQVAENFDQKEVITIGGKEAIKLSFQRGEIKISSYERIMEEADSIFVKPGRNIFLITLYHRETAKFGGVFDQILSTFRFID